MHCNKNNIYNVTLKIFFFTVIKYEKVTITV